MDKKDKLFLAWANLVDLGFEMALGNLKRRKNDKLALRELKASLLHQSEERWRAICRIAKRLR